MVASVSDVSSLVQAGVGVATFLGSGVMFVWGRVEKINRDRKREIDRCNAERLQDRILGRERRAVLLTIIESLLHVIGRHDPSAPEIRETNTMLADFKNRERIEAEQDTTN